MKDIQSILSQMTLEEKAALCTGASHWATTPVERLGVPEMVVSDGPHGVRRVPDVRSAVTLANQMLNGIDINGNEIIDPIPGEGGAKTAFEHAGYMTDMPILPGKDQVPSKGQ